ncbi:MAG: hypothetical protein H0T89_37005 [Deltaproteobacteria bacterium]|nr:hypothetical protein [Deltaproteobacteria bacterium]
MSRAASLTILAALLAATPSCAFAVKHPAITAGAVAGTVALTTCELASSDHGRCFLTSGAVGIGLALIAGVALWLGSEDEVVTTSEPAPKIDWEKVPDTTPAEPTKAPPPLDPAPAPVTPPTPTPTPTPPTPPPPTPPTPTTPTPTTPPPAT